MCSETWLRLAKLTYQDSTRYEFISSFFLSFFPFPFPAQLFLSFDEGVPRTVPATIGGTIALACRDFLELYIFRFVCLFRRVSDGQQANHVCQSVSQCDVLCVCVCSVKEFVCLV